MRFTIKNNLALLATITLATHAFAIFEPIPDASYVIYEGGKVPSLLSAPKNVTFYTFDGNPIITVKYPQAYICYLKINRLRLDPAAPKPQPVTYEIKPVSKMHGLFGSGKSIIFFYDKHDNVIAKFECYKKSNTIARELIQSFGSFSLDLSRVTEKPRKSKK